MSKYVVVREVPEGVPFDNTPHKIHETLDSAHKEAIRLAALYLDVHYEVFELVKVGYAFSTKKTKWVNV